MKAEELAKLKLRVLDFPAGDSKDRWTLIQRGRVRDQVSSENEEDEAEKAEAVYGPLTASVAEILESIPLMHRLVCAEREVVNAAEEESVREHMNELYEMEAKEEVLALARRERCERKLYAECFGYSEVDPAFFMSLLAKLRRVHGHLRLANSGVFVECGSGLGQNVYIAGLMHSWQRCVGIEKLAALSRKAQSLRDNFHSISLQRLSQKERDLRKEMGLAFICNDFFKVQDLLFGATLLYADLTCFTPHEIQTFTDLTTELVPGAVVVVLTRPLFDSSDTRQHLFLLWTQENDVLTSWGHTSAFIYERRPYSD